MKTTQRLYEAAHPIWEQCHAHPFVRGIGDGSLDLEKFQWFLLQDYLYLFDYARVFAYGVVKARDPELMRTFSANVDAILGGEMKVHRAYMARLGITEEQVFAVQGIGQMLASSISNRDYPVVQAIVALIALVVVVCNFAADLLYRVMDPRLRQR